MPATKPSASGAVFFLGADQGIFDGVHAALTPRNILVRGFRTVAGMMLATATTKARILVVVPHTLPQERTPESVVERLALATGIRPVLLCLAAEGESAEEIRARHPTAADVFEPPYDWRLLADCVGQLLEAEESRVWRILIVDADPAEGAMISDWLRKAGMVAELVGEAERVRPALERLKPDLLLLDLGLPHGGGRAVTETVRDHGGFHDLPIVFLSKDGGVAYQRESLTLGGDDYLARPLDPEQLLATLRRRIPRGSDAATSGFADDESELISRIHLLQRLDQAIHDHPIPAPGQAVLTIRIDPDRPSLAPFGEGGLAAVRPVILDLAKRLAGSALRGSCNSEGDLLLWVRCRDDHGVAALAEEIRAAAQALEIPMGFGLARPTLSIGVGSFLPPADDALTLISRAQSACAQAREQGGNRVIMHRPMVSVDLSGSDEEALLELIRQALTGKGFQLVYQPILALRKKRHERYEVLLRLRTPQGDLVPPLTFLPVAARNGLLPAVDRWVLSEALTVLRAERDARRPTQLLIFQSAESLASPGWLQWVRDEILRLDLIRQRPVFEFNAQDILQNDDQAGRLFPELARLGIQICLAGVGDSERILDLIGRRRIALVKLARDLVASSSVARLQWLVNEMHRQDTRVIAAGIEDPETIGRAWASGADYIQGNFIRFPEDSLGFQFEETAIG